MKSRGQNPKISDNICYLIPKSRGFCTPVLTLNPDREISSEGLKKAVDKYEETCWKAEIEEKVTLGIYKRKEHIGDESLYANDEPSILLFRARTNTLDLSWRGEFVGKRTDCRMCNKGEIETLSHFVIECDYLRDIRDRFDIDGEVGMERILMFDQGGRGYHHHPVMFKSIRLIYRKYGRGGESL